MNLDFNIWGIVKHSSKFEAAKQKISELWLNSPTEAAYYSLKGYKVQSGVLQTSAWEITAMCLAKIRAKHPEITKEEVIELVRKKYAKIH